MKYLSGQWKLLVTREFILTFISSLASVTALLFCVDAFARPGGGGNYSGGGGFGGGGGGGGGGGDIGALIYLIFLYPEIGVPVAVVVVAVALVKRNRNPDRTTFRAVSNLMESAGPSLGSLEDIKARDRGFDEPQFLDLVRALTEKLNDAWCRGDMRPVRTLLSDGLMRRFETQLAIMKHQGVRNTMADFQVLSLRLHASESDSHFDTLHVWLQAKARDVEVSADLSFEQALKKAQKAPNQSYSEVWSFLRKPGVQTTPGVRTPDESDPMTTNCPSCGAELNSGQTTRCDHCQAIVNSGEYNWVLAEITQPEEWRPRSTGSVPGLVVLTNSDPGFNRQVAEDRAAYLFWRWIESMVRADARPLSKVADPAFKDRIAEQVTSGPSALFKVAAGGVDLVACELGRPGKRDRYHAKVFWSSARSQSGAAIPMINLFTLSRKHGAANQGGLSYARCPECQGPLTENDAPLCDYCGTDLSAGESDWVLEDVRHPEELRIPENVHSSETSVPGPNMANPQERTLLLMRMAAVVVSDGVVTKAEQRLLQNAAKRWRVPMEAVEPILSQKIDLDVTMAMRPKDPKAFVNGLIDAALVDGRIDKKEMRLLVDVGQSLGLASGQIKNMCDNAAAMVSHR